VSKKLSDLLLKLKFHPVHLGAKALQGFKNNLSLAPSTFLKVIAPTKSQNILLLGNQMDLT
jgi:hypothetical protein